MLFLLVVFGCAGDLPDDDLSLPPPASPVLDVGDLISGQPFVLHAEGLPPGATLRLAAGTPGRGPCVAAGECLDIRVRHDLGRVTVDPAGEALLVTPPLPALPPDVEFTFQGGVPGQVVTTAVTRAVGAHHVSVDASAGGAAPGGGPEATAWVYFSFDQGIVTPANPMTSTDWDLRFQRYWIGLNGGTSGPGDTTAARLPGAAWASVRTPDPAWAWLEDAPDADGDGIDELAMLDWYRYDPRTHTLAAQDEVWVIDTTDDRYFRVEMLYGYYDAAGVSGMPSLRWTELPGPTP